MSDRAFRKQLNDAGYKIVNCPKDGNCLYHAILKDVSISCPYQNVDSLREATATYLERNRNEFKDILLAWIRERIKKPRTTNNLSEEELLQKAVTDRAYLIRQDGEWAGNLEIGIISRIIEVPVLIHQPNNIIIPLGIEYTGHGPVIRVSYHNGNHYNFLEDRGRNNPPRQLQSSTVSNIKRASDRQWCHNAVDGIKARESEATNKANNRKGLPTLKITERNNHGLEMDKSCHPNANDTVRAITTESIKSAPPALSNVNVVNIREMLADLQPNSANVSTTSQSPVYIVDFGGFYEKTRYKQDPLSKKGITTKPNKRKILMEPVHSVGEESVNTLVKNKKIESKLRKIGKCSKKKTQTVGSCASTADTLNQETQAEGDTVPENAVGPGANLKTIEARKRKPLGREQRECPICKDILATDKYVTHITGKHKMAWDEYLQNYEFEGPGIECKLCGSIAKSRKTYNLHINTKHKLLKHKCRLCNEIQLNAMVLGTHLKKHHGVSIVKYLQENFGLTLHDIVPVRCLTYVCDICGTNLKSPRDYVWHMKTHNNLQVQNNNETILVYQNTKLLKSINYADVKICFSSEITQGRGRQSKYKKTDFECGLCHHFLKSECELTYHINMIHKLHWHLCYICGERTKNANSLKNHLYKYHDKEKLSEYLAIYCNLDLAEVVAEAKPTFPCSLCTLVFDDPNTYIYHCNNEHHMQLTPKDVPGTFQIVKSPHPKKNKRLYFANIKGDSMVLCDECGKSFLSKRLLNGHKKEVHTKFSVFCPLCRKQFANNKKMKVHLKFIHQKYIYDIVRITPRRPKHGKLLTCKVCGKDFSTYNSLHAHKRFAHNKGRQNCESAIVKVEQNEIIENHADNDTIDAHSNEDYFNLHVLQCLGALELCAEGQINIFKHFWCPQRSPETIISAIASIKECPGCGAFINTTNHPSIISHAIERHNEDNSVEISSLHLVPLFKSLYYCPICRVSFNEFDLVREEHIFMHKNNDLLRSSKYHFEDYIAAKTHQECLSSYSLAVDIFNMSIQHIADEGRICLLIFLPFRCRSLKQAYEKLRLYNSTNKYKIPIYLTNKKGANIILEQNLFPEVQEFSCICSTLYHPFHKWRFCCEEMIRRQFAIIYIILIGLIWLDFCNNNDEFGFQFYLLGSKSHEERLRKYVSFLKDEDPAFIFNNIFANDVSIICRTEWHGETCSNLHCKSLLHIDSSTLMRESKNESTNLSFPYDALQALSWSIFFESCPPSNQPEDILQYAEDLALNIKQFCKRLNESVYFVSCSDFDSDNPRRITRSFSIPRLSVEVRDKFLLYVGKTRYHGMSKSHFQANGSTSFRKAFDQGFDNLHYVYNSRFKMSKSEKVEGMIQLSNIFYKNLEKYNNISFVIINERHEWRQIWLIGFMEMTKFLHVMIDEGGIIFDTESDCQPFFVDGKSIVLSHGKKVVSRYPFDNGSSSAVEVVNLE